MGSRAQHIRRTLLTVVLLFLLVRLWLIFGISRGPEVFEYDELARNLLSGRGYVYNHLETPYRSLYSGIFYIWLTAGLYMAFPSGRVAVLVAQSIISAVLAVVIFHIARMLWSPVAGMFAGLLTVSHPALALYDTHKLHPLSFDSLVISLAVFALLRVRVSSSAATAVIAGLVVGAAILQRGSVILLVPLGMCWLWFFSQRDSQRLRRIAGYVLGAMVVVAPWLTRSYVIHGVPFLISVTAEHFWTGNAPYSSGSNLLPSGQTVLDVAPAGFRAELLTRDELGQSQLFWESALEHVRARPREFVLGIASKFLGFWAFSRQTGVLYPSLFFYLYTAYYLTVVTLAAVGAIRLVSAENSREATFPGALLILSVFLSVSLIQSVFYVELRHRWVIEPLLLSLSSVGLLCVWRWRRAGGRISPSVCR